MIIIKFLKKKVLMDKIAISHWSPEIGGQFWWNGLLFALLFVLFMLFIGRKLSPRQRNYILCGMGIYQLAVKFTSQMLLIFYGNYILSTHLPLQLCTMSGILAGIVIFYRRQILFELLYFYGIIGFIHSIITPEFTEGTSPWNIFDYYVGHSMLLIVPVWLMIYNDLKLRHNSWWTSFVYLQVLVVFVSQANSIIGDGANYMFLAKAPIADSPFILQDPYHVVGFEIFALIHFYVLYIIGTRIFGK